ncbi:unnamed protein product [Auanema sp. JU1783]|nr:unnamed protein product [Auanema sp. JU1783]
MSTFWGVATASTFNYEQAKAYTSSVTFPYFIYSLFYVAVIFSLKSFMTNRKPLELKTPLNLWNAWLAVFSTLGGLVTGLGLVNEIYHRGFVSSYTRMGDFFNGASGWWTWLFVMSKAAEFGDTIFIVLRKRPLIFLHWYHHVLTMNYAMYSYVHDTAFNSWITWMNFSVHSIMYGYYMLRSLGFRIPAWIAQNITTLQLLQFIVTLGILFHVGYLRAIGEVINCSTTVFWFCLIMEISYVALFGNFYYQSYMKGGGKKYQAEQKKKAH